MLLSLPPQHTPGRVEQRKGQAQNTQHPPVPQAQADVKEVRLSFTTDSGPDLARGFRAAEESELSELLHGSPQPPPHHSAASSSTGPGPAAVAATAPANAGVQSSWVWSLLEWASPAEQEV